MSDQVAPDAPDTPTNVEPDTPAPALPDPEPAEVDDDGHDDDAPLDPEKRRKLVSEARNLRRRLREAEGAREQLAARVLVYERAEVEAVAKAEGMLSPDDLWQGFDLDTIRDDDGALDLAKLGAHLADVKASRPHYFAGGGAWPDASQGTRGHPAIKRDALTESFLASRGNGRLPTGRL